MKNIINIAQIAISVLLIASILIQNKGAGLSGTFGGDGNAYRTKRGAEKFLLYFTIVLGIGLAGLSLAHILL